MSLREKMITSSPLRGQVKSKNWPFPLHLNPGLNLTCRNKVVLHLSMAVVASCMAAPPSWQHCSSRDRGVARGLPLVGGMSSLIYRMKFYDIE